MPRIVLILLLSLLSQFSCAFSRTVEITEKELQTKISEKMPLIKDKKYIALVLNNAKIDLLPDNNKIALSSDLNIKVPGSINSNGNATVIGSLKYKPDKGAFYLDKPEVISLNIDQLPEKKQLLIKNIAQIVLTKILSKTPIYKLKDKDLEQRLIKSSLESVTVEEERVLIKFSPL